MEILWATLIRIPSLSKIDHSPHLLKSIKCWYSNLLIVCKNFSIASYEVTRLDLDKLDIFLLCTVLWPSVGQTRPVVAPVSVLIFLDIAQELLLATQYESHILFN